VDKVLAADDNSTIVKQKQPKEKPAEKNDDKEKTKK